MANDEPTYEGLPEDLTAAVLIWLLRGISVLVLVDVSVILPFLAPDKTANAAMAAAMAIGALAIPYVLLRKGHPIIGARVCVAAGAALSTILALSVRGGVNSVATAFQLAVAATAVMMLGQRWGLWIAGFCLSADLANTLFEVLGHPLPIIFRGGQLAAWLMLVLVFGVALVPLHSAFRTLQSQLTRREQAENALHRLNRLYALLSACSQAVIGAETESALFTEVCHVAATVGGMRVAVVGMIDLATRSITAVAAAGEDAARLIGFQLNSLDNPPAPGPVWKCIHEQGTVVANDYLNDPTTGPWKAEAVRRGIRSMIALPLLREGGVVGALAFYAGTRAFFTQEEVALASKIAEIISHALDTMKQQSRQRLLEKALESSDECVGITDADGNFVYANAAFFRTYGYSKDELLGQPLERIRSPHNSPELVTAVFEAMRNAGWRGEILNRTKDGRDIPCALTGSALFDDHGKVIGLIGLTHDITPQRAQQEHLLLLEAAISRINDIVLITRAEPIDGPGGPEIVSVNDAFTRLTGYSRDEVIGKTPRILQGPRTQRDELDRIRQALVDCKPIRSELINYTKSGEEYWLELEIVPLVDEKGRCAYSIAVQRDITERKVAEEKRAQLEAQLAWSQKRELDQLRETQRLARLGSWSWDVATNEVHWSEQLYRHVGMNPSEPPPGFEGNAQFYTAESWALLTSAVEAAVRDGTPYTLELRLSQSAPLTEWIIARGEAVFDANGKVLALRGTAQDVTERKNLELQLAQAQKMESIGRLAGGVAHDFNNMLTVIMGYAAMLKRDSAPDSKELKRLTEIEKAGDRAKQLTQKLLGFSRRQIIAPVPSNLNDLVRDLMEPLKRLIGEDIELSLFEGTDLWTVLVDASQVNQILLNLAVNARDAMPSGGKLTIETENVWVSEEYSRTRAEARPGAFVVLSVSDTGEGIAPEILPRIFEPFFTTKSVDKGTGLGLSLVYGIAKQNEGFVNAYSELGLGSTFRIYFPRIAGAPVAGEELRAGGVVSTGRGTVLVVEDEDLVRELVTSSLERIGYTPISAASPAEAIELCSSADGATIDLVLTDVVMPGMNGMELRDRIRAVRGGMRVLFMSGYTSNVIVKHGILKPDVHFIQKPFTLNELSRRIKEVMAS